MPRRRLGACDRWLGDKSWGAVEQRLDVKEHGDETTRSRFAKRKRHATMNVAHSDSSFVKAN
jgi:hypothetical protein